jgi:hypothetical protein
MLETGVEKRMTSGPAGDFPLIRVLSLLKARKSVPLRALMPKLPH